MLMGSGFALVEVCFWCVLCIDGFCVWALDLVYCCWWIFLWWALVLLQLRSTIVGTYLVLLFGVGILGFSYNLWSSIELGWVTEACCHTWGGFVYIVISVLLILPSILITFRLLIFLLLFTYIVVEFASTWRGMGVTVDLRFRKGLPLRLYMSSYSSSILTVVFLIVVENIVHFEKPKINEFSIVSIYMVSIMNKDKIECYKAHNPGEIGMPVMFNRC